MAILENNFRLCTSVIPANHHDPSVTTEHESAAIESGATDASRPAGFIRACRLLLYGLRIPLQQGTVVPRTPRRSRHSTDEPSAHPWHQISSCCCTKGGYFEANAGIQGELGPGVRRDDGNVPFGNNFTEMLSQSELVLIGTKGSKEKP
jgi:hypothetical protein